MPAAARKIALKDSSLKALKPAPDGSRQTVWDALMPNMAVRVSALGKRSFYAVKRRPGDEQPTWHLLGAYPPHGIMTLGEARTAAREALTALMAGQHPKTLALEKRRAADAAAREAIANTFGAVAEAFGRQYVSEMKASSARMYDAYLRRELVPALGARPVAEIRRREVITLIEDIKGRSGKAAATGALSVLRKCLNWALGRDLPGFESNPASAITVKDVIGVAPPRKRLITDAELPALWAATGAVGQPFEAIYRLLLLTGLRLNEIAGARWADFDLDGAVLTVPAERSKTGEPMLVPLTPSAVALFEAAPRFSGEYIFSTTAGRRPVQAFSHAKERLDAAIAAHGAVVAPFVIHDFRKVVRSALSRLGVETVVAELVLGHTRSGIEGVYDLHSFFDEKRAALALWEKRLLSIVAPEPPAEGNVVALRAGARG